MFYLPNPFLKQPEILLSSQFSVLHRYTAMPFQNLCYKPLYIYIRRLNYLPKPRNRERIREESITLNYYLTKVQRQTIYHMLAIRSGYQLQYQNLFRLQLLQVYLAHTEVPAN